MLKYKIINIIIYNRRIILLILFETGEFVMSFGSGFVSDAALKYVHFVLYRIYIIDINYNKHYTTVPSVMTGRRCLKCLNYFSS